MGRDERRRQAALQRKAARRKEKRKAVEATVVPASPRAIFRGARRWPLHECLISRDWNGELELVQILVARRSPADEIAAGVFLVDLGCLGVKSAFGTVVSLLEYERGLRQQVTSRQPMMQGNLDLAARIIREGIAYARRWGFEPDPDYYEAATILEGANPDACDVPIPLGKDGKPFFVAGPYDNVDRVIAKLNKTAGPGNYHYIVPLGEPPPGLLFEEEDADEEEDES